jgi:hypothetical protein
MAEEVGLSSITPGAVAGSDGSDESATVSALAGRGRGARGAVSSRA